VHLGVQLSWLVSWLAWLAWLIQLVHPQRGWVHVHSFIQFGNPHTHTYLSFLCTTMFPATVFGFCLVVFFMNEKYCALEKLLDAGCLLFIAEQLATGVAK